MNLRVALVHDWLIHMRGGEKVLEALVEVFPQADIHTLFFDRTRLSPVFDKVKIKGSFLQYLPGIKSCYRWLLPVLPFAARSLRLDPYDLVISSSHCVAKACRVPSGALHICYCHTPARYVWGFEDEYFGRYPVPIRKVIHALLGWLRKQDLESNRGVHFFIANSQNTARRIEKYYQREAEVIHPPVDTVRLGQVEEKPGEGFLVVSALVPYKRVDLAVEAFNRLGYPLTIVGSGPELGRLKRMAGPNVRFLGALSDEEVRDQYAGTRALIFPGEEDFGIVPVEAEACGKPVIAFARGGALETVTGGTGVFFSEQTAESLMEAVRRFEKLPFHAAIIREHAARFDRKAFQDKMRLLIANLCETWKNRKIENLDNHLPVTRK